MEKTENEFVHKISPVGENSETCSFLRSLHEENELNRGIKTFTPIHIWPKIYTQFVHPFFKYNYDYNKSNKK